MKKDFSTIFKRELEVAFAKQAQPVWLRILKYVVLGCLLFFLWDSKYLGVILLIMVVGSLMVHGWYRYKTKGWTRSYGKWDYEKNKPKN